MSVGPNQTSNLRFQCFSSSPSHTPLSLFPITWSCFVLWETIWASRVYRIPNGSLVLGITKSSFICRSLAWSNFGLGSVAWAGLSILLLLESEAQVLQPRAFLWAQVKEFIVSYNPPNKLLEQLAPAKLTGQCDFVPDIQLPWSLPFYSPTSCLVLFIHYFVSNMGISMNVLFVCKG